MGHADMVSLLMDRGALVAAAYKVLSGQHQPLLLVAQASGVHAMMVKSVLVVLAKDVCGGSLVCSLPCRHSADQSDADGSLIASGHV